jgi:hypothetical protein
MHVYVKHCGQLRTPTVSMVTNFDIYEVKRTNARLFVKHSGLLRIPSVLVVSKFNLYNKSKVIPSDNFWILIYVITIITNGGGILKDLGMLN